ncbi:hypothetical protein REPUB_Repub01dG0104500 [Reevesia pubescens]
MNYQFWSTRIAVYIQACDMDMWDIIMEGPFISAKKNESNEVVPKSKSEWTADDKTKVSSIEDELIHMSDISEDDDELVLATRRFNRLLLKRNPRYGRRSSRKDLVSLGREKVKKNSGTLNKNKKCATHANNRDTTNMSALSLRKKRAKGPRKRSTRKPW